MDLAESKRTFVRIWKSLAPDDQASFWAKYAPQVGERHAWQAVKKAWGVLPLSARMAFLERYALPDWKEAGWDAPAVRPQTLGEYLEWWPAVAKRAEREGTYEQRKGALMQGFMIRKNPAREPSDQMLKIIHAWVDELFEAEPNLVGD